MPSSLDFSRCRNVWVPDESEAGGHWSPPPPHVRYGVEQIVNHPYFLLADDMGGMKTAQSIISAQFLHEMGVIDRVIVVAPAAVRPKVWFDQDLGQLREQVWDTKRNIISEFHQSIRKWAHGPEDAPELRWIITNFEFIRKSQNLAVLFPYCGPKTLLVLDESSAVRNWDSQQTIACMKLRWRTNAKGHPVLGVPRCGRILLLNGTPVAESPMDMFSQGNLMHPSILQCRFITHYRARYAIQEPVMTLKGEPKLDKWNRPILTIKTGAEGWQNLEDLQKRFAPYVLRREAKDLGINFALPPVGLTVTLTEQTWKAYKDMRDDMVVWIKSGVATAQTAAARSLRLAQITSGFLGGVEDDQGLQSGFLESLDLGDLYGAGSNPANTDTLDAVPDPTGNGRHQPKTLEVGREKLDFALQWHAELLRHHPNLKLLTWCRFVPELQRYLREVQAKFPTIPVGAACGQKIFEGEHNQAYEREFALRLLHPKTAPAGPATVGATQGTGALGLNFTACRTVLDMSYDFSPWKKKQGDSRVNRPGQTGPVSFFYLIAVGPKGQKTFDHHIMMTRLGKTNINDWTMSAWTKALTEE